MTENKTPDAIDLKRQFLELAEPVMKQYIAAATGEGSLQGTSMVAREAVWNLLSDLIMKSSDRIKIEIDSPKDILDAVARGDCTFEEGTQLLKLYKQIQEIENPQGQGGGGHGLTVIVNNGEAKPALEAQELKTLKHQIEEVDYVERD